MSRLLPLCLPQPTSVAAARANTVMQTFATRFMRPPTKMG